MNQFTTWRECTLCGLRYPRNTSGMSPCCDAQLMTVVDEVAHWPPKPMQQSVSRGTHDEHCESELTSHGYTPCRCAERVDSRPASPSAPHAHSD